MERDTAALAICTNCRSGDRWILHHFHRRNTYHRLCTACLLKLNTKSFCPICFSLHHRPKVPAASPAVAPVARGTLVCIRCNSLSHTSCVAPNAPKSPFLCPTCSNPNLNLFDFSKAAGQAFDLASSKAFLAAATIAANSLNEAAERAGIEMERKSKEAVLAKKKAKEALGKVALIWIRDQERMKLRDAAEASLSMDYSNGVQPINLGAS